MRRTFLTFAVIVALLVFGPVHAKENEYVVKKVIDGDTIELDSGETVRYLGIDAPEMYKKEGGTEFYARDATRANRRLVFMKKVRLEFDVEKKDHYGRVLAYVFVKDQFINGELVKQGFAKAHVKPPNTKYRDLLVGYQQKAMEQEKGLWQESKKETEKVYIGNKRTYSLHRPSCKYLGKVPEKSRIIFRSRADAIKVGYIPCKQCKP